MKQLDLFSDKKCAHCNKTIPPSPKNSHILNGFIDLDTGQNVCWPCKQAHYYAKSQTQFKNQYSEMPLIATNLT